MGNNVLIENVKKEMQNQKITQAKLAEILGKSRTTINNIFTGNASEFSARDLGIMCKLFKVPPHSLMGLKSWDKDIDIDDDADYSDSQYDELATKLSIKGYRTDVFNTNSEAVSYIIDICKDKTVGLGSAIAFEMMGLVDALDKAKIVYLYASETGKIRNDKESEIKAINSSVFLLPVSGISFETADMINISANGSKIAGSLYCAEEIIFVIGKNKISSNLEKAISKHKNGYVTKVVKMGGAFDTPCAKNGKCEGDCNSPDKFCRTICTYKAPPFNVESTVILVKEEVGY